MTTSVATVRSSNNPRSIHSGLHVCSYERQTCTCCPYGHTDTRGNRVHRRFVNAHVFYTTLRNAPRAVFSLLCYSSHSFTSNLHLLMDYWSTIDFTIEDLLCVRMYDKFTRSKNNLLWKEKKNRLDYISLINLLKNLHLFRIRFRRINDVLVYNILNMWKMFSVFFSLNLNAVLNKKIWTFMNFIHSRNNLNKEDKYIRI